MRCGAVRCGAVSRVVVQRTILQRVMLLCRVGRVRASVAWACRWAGTGSLPRRERSRPGEDAQTVKGEGFGFNGRCSSESLRWTGLRRRRGSARRLAPGARLGSRAVAAVKAQRRGMDAGRREGGVETWNHHRFELSTRWPGPWRAFRHSLRTDWCCRCTATTAHQPR